MTAPFSPPATRTQDGHRNRNRIMACVDPSGLLVYLRTLKCASTFFYNNFMQTFGWREIAWVDINWHRQKVFSHMLDPVKRRHKAVAEYIDLCSLNTPEFMQNPNVQRFIRYIPVMDDHSSSYHDLYGYACYSIDWIPLSGDHLTNILCTEMLCESYGHRYSGQWDHDHDHTGTKTKKDLEQQLENLWGADQDEWVHNYLDRDVRLYQRVVNQFNYSAGSWRTMSWLTGRTQ